MPRRLLPSEDEAELTARCATAQEMQQTVRARLRQLKQHARKERARSRSRWQAMVTFGVMVFTILGGDFSWAPSLLSRFQQTAEPEEVEAAITKAYLELTAEELEQLLAPEGRVSKRSAAAQAHAFATEFAVWKWVDEQNCCTGLAPSVADVVQRRNLCVDETEAGVWGEFTATPSRKEAASYKWVARWKRSWDLAFGKASQHEVIPTETIRTKALDGVPETPPRRAPHCIGDCCGSILAQGGEASLRQRPPPPPSTGLAWLRGRTVRPRKSASWDPLKLGQDMDRGVPKMQPAWTRRGPDCGAASWPRNWRRPMCWLKEWGPFSGP